jgi:hypothetical protein
MHSVTLARTKAIKDEISSRGPVISLSYGKQASIASGGGQIGGGAAADRDDLPIIVGWGSLDLQKGSFLGESMLEVWIVRKKSTGAQEFHVPFGAMNIETNVAIPL